LQFEKNCDIVIPLMAIVIPFKGVRYNTGKVKDPARVLAPPYDIISQKQKEELYELSPYNIVQIDFGKVLETDTESENRYTRASHLLNDWMKSGVLIRDEHPCFYCYEITYTLRGKELKFRGLMGLVGLEPFESGVVLPHEETRSKPKADRLNLMRSTKANISPIFSLYSSKRKIASSILNSVTITSEPVIEGTDSMGGIHRLWRIDDEADMHAISGEMQDLKIFIADGHHRYETALEYMREMKDKDSTGGSGYVMMFLANMEDSGLSVLPTYRLIKKVPSDMIDRLKKRFNMESVTMTADSLNFLDDLTKREGHCFGVYSGGGSGFVFRAESGAFADMNMPSPPLGSLDVIVLHRLILEKILDVNEFSYEMSAAEAIKMVDSGEFEAAFFLKATRLHELKNVALDGKRMPPKSTYFFPKLMTGMVLNLLD